MNSLSNYLALVCLVLVTSLPNLQAKSNTSIDCQITLNPSSASICSGNSTTFEVGASGTGLTYKWQVDVGFGFLDLKSNATFSDIDKPVLKVNTVSTMLNGYKFKCIVNSSCGELVSTEAELTVLTSPNISSNPSSTSVCQNSDVVFQVGSTGSQLTYQWQEDKNDGSGFTDISNSMLYSGFNTQTLTVKSAGANYNGYKYRVVIDGVCSGAVTSNPASLTVKPLISINSQPQTAYTCSSLPESQRTVSFTVEATGSDLTYQWQVDAGFGFVSPPTTPIHTGINSKTLTVSYIKPEFDGYIYRCIVTSSCGGVQTTSTALLKVNSSTVQPQDFTQKSNSVYKGQTDVSYSVPPVAGVSSYDWAFKNSEGEIVPGVTIYGNGSNSVLVDFASNAESGNMTVCTINGCGVSATRNVSVAVTEPPVTLPVELASYSADLTPSSSASLKWVTASESNNDHFIVEHSINGIDYKQIARVQSKGNNLVPQYYSIHHRDLTAGINYYRLMQVDKNGDRKELGIKALNVSLAGYSNYAYPNPLAGNQLNIKFSTEKPTLPVRISSISGQVLFDKSVNVSNNTIDISLNNKPEAGFYLISVDGKFLQKLVVN